LFSSDSKLIDSQSNITKNRSTIYKKLQIGINFRYQVPNLAFQSLFLFRRENIAVCRAYHRSVLRPQPLQFLFLFHRSRKESLSFTFELADTLKEPPLFFPELADQLRGGP